MYEKKVINPFLNRSRFIIVDGTFVLGDWKYPTLKADNVSLMIAFSMRTNPFHQTRWVPVCFVPLTIKHQNGATKHLRSH